MSERNPPAYSLRFNLQLGLGAGLLFWVQFAYPNRAVTCWSILGAMLFLALSYPSRFWAAVTGIFGFEAGLLLGMVLRVQNHLLWIAGGFVGAVLLTLLENFRLGSIPLPKRPAGSLRIEVLIREVGLGAFAGSVAATVLRSEALRLFVLAGLIVALRLLLDSKHKPEDPE